MAQGLLNFGPTKSQESIIASIGFNEAIANGRGRRRFGPGSPKSSSDEVTEKSSGDQAVAASSHTESNQYRRGGAYSTDAGDYTFNTADINLIRPESKPIHTKITAKYTSSITIPHDSLEDTETAEEYVAKAMGMYGSRLREPIRIPNEVEPTQAEQPLQHQQYQQHLQQQLQQQQQEQHEQHEQQLQNLKQHEKHNNFDYFTFTQKEAQPQAATPIEEEQPQQQINYHQYTQHSSQHSSQHSPQHSPQHSSQHPSQQQQQQQSPADDAKEIVEAQIQAQLQEQIQQAQYLVQEREQEEQNQQQAQEQSQQEDSANPQHEKDPVTRSYNIYEEQTAGYDTAEQSVVDRNYRTKYVYKPVPQYHSLGQETEEKIRVSASTEIPKAEIMKQIEKSVIKYMKELEAEGKIIAAPQKEEPKTYYKVITVPGSDEKRIGSTTSKPSKYNSNSNGNYQDSYKHSASQHSPSSTLAQKYYKNSGSKSSYQSETESTYQAPAHDVSELAPNVEFIYKIKTKAPLHTATVKTVSKPYNLPIKTYDQFDHSSALKNLEEFDLSHVVTTPDPEEHLSASTNKPSKLYFNSEIYHDINSLPYKQKQRVEAEYRKLKAAAAAGEIHPDYKGYSGSSSAQSQSGYYAEPPADRGESEREASGSNMSEDGYPIMNPYSYVLKKEALPGKYDETAGSYEQQQQQQPRSHKYKPVEYDSYSPKFNNNPEGYGYQQTYKTHLSTRHSPGKRGKRGGSPHPSLNKKSPHRSSSLKDYEANIALRPPPKI